MQVNWQVALGALLNLLALAVQICLLYRFYQTYYPPGSAHPLLDVAMGGINSNGDYEYRWGKLGLFWLISVYQLRMWFSLNFVFFDDSFNQTSSVRFMASKATHFDRLDFFLVAIIYVTFIAFGVSLSQGVNAENLSAIIFIQVSATVVYTVKIFRRLVLEDDQRVSNRVILVGDAFSFLLFGLYFVWLVFHPSSALYLISLIGIVSPLHYLMGIACMVFGLFIAEIVAAYAESFKRAFTIVLFAFASASKMSTSGESH